MDTARRFLRPAAAIVLALVWTYLVLVAGIVFGFAGESLGWLWVTLPVAVGLVPAALVWGAVNRSIAIGVAIALAVGIGGLSWDTSPPSNDRIAAQADTAVIPEGWELVREHETGNAFLFSGGGPTVVRGYAADRDLTEARADLQSSLEDDGWDVDEASGDRFTKGRWQVTIDATERPYMDGAFMNMPLVSLTFEG